MENLKNLIQYNLDYLNSLSVKEHTLYKKYIQLNTSSIQKWYRKNITEIHRVKNNIWKPKSIDDYKNLNIKVIPADDEETLLKWRILREFSHGAVWNSSPGRMLRFIITHNETIKDLFGNDLNIEKYLGIISLGSDFIGVGGRDNYIGWTKENKENMLNHSCMGSTISPTQPFGFNYVGGKLITLMVCSDVVENTWNQKYDEKLAGITTTSLYGGYSQYTRLKYWKKCKSTKGKVLLEPTDDIYELIKEYYKKNNPKICDNPSHIKYKILSYTYNKLNIKTYSNEASRGVYWCGLYENTNEFLREQDKELKNKKFDNSVNALFNLWLNKYAEKRINSLIVKDTVKEDMLFFDDIINKPWIEVKQKYLGE